MNDFEVDLAVRGLVGRMMAGDAECDPVSAVRMVKALRKVADDVRKSYAAEWAEEEKSGGEPTTPDDRRSPGNDRGEGGNGGVF